MYLRKIPRQKREMPVLGYDQQGHVGNDIEDNKNDFEKPEKRVYGHVEGFSGDVEPFTVHTVHKILGQHNHCGREDKHGSVNDCAPHKESC